MKKSLVSPKMCPLFVAIALLFQGGAWAQGGDEDYRFRPESEYQALGAQTAYEQYLEEENVPVYTGWAANVLNIDLKPWKRQGQGITGAFVNLEGMGGAVDNYVMEIQPGASTNPEHHIYEETTFVMSGEGETHLWRQGDSEKKVVIRWRKGTIFAPPLNTWHQHFNKGTTPVRLAVGTTLPLMMDLFRSRNFIWNNPLDFPDRYAGQPDYFDPENRIDYGPTTEHHSLTLSNMVRNAWTWRLFNAGQGYKDTDRHIILSKSAMSTRVEQFPIGTYERGHRHKAGVTIVLITGTGYTFLWPNELGKTPWKDGKGDQVQRLEWEPGVLFVPPEEWYHQHFNSGTEPTRYVRLGAPPGNEVYKVGAIGLALGASTRIQFREEDPYVRNLFEKELAKQGATIQMPSQEELIRLEEEAGGGFLMAAETPDGE